MSNKLKLIFVVVITLIAIIAVSVIPPIPQDVNYHDFADDRCLISIPNFWNVVSNIPLLLIGIIGMIFTRNSRSEFVLKELTFNCLVFFMGIFFTGIGSAYYHYHPTTDTLVWDRLPMTISFMAFFSIVIGDTISLKFGKQILFPLLFLGNLSVLYWVMTESKGQGDLRFYALIQYLPVVLIPMLLLLFKSVHNMKFYFWYIVLLYVTAKLFETLDYPVFFELKMVSGHSIKHLFAALAPIVFLLGLYKRKPIKSL